MVGNERFHPVDLTKCAKENSIEIQNKNLNVALIYAIRAKETESGRSMEIEKNQIGSSHEYILHHESDWLWI